MTDLERGVRGYSLIPRLINPDVGDRKEYLRSGEMVKQEIFDKRGVLAEATTKLLEEMRDGLRHGFFECTITCELIKDGKRCLIIRAGKSYQFIISKEELSD